MLLIDCNDYAIPSKLLVFSVNNLIHFMFIVVFHLCRFLLLKVVKEHPILNIGRGTDSPSPCAQMQETTDYTLGRAVNRTLNLIMCIVCLNVCSCCSSLSHPFCSEVISVEGSQGEIRISEDSYEE